MDEVDGSKSRKVNGLSIDGDGIAKSFPLGLDLFRGKTIDSGGYVGGVVKGGGASVDIIILGAGEVKPEGAILIANGNEYTIDSISRLDQVNGGWCGSRLRAVGEKKDGKHYQGDKDMKPVV